MVSFREIADCRVNYDRRSQADYGTRGGPATFRCGPGFKRKLDACFEEVWSLTGKAEVITSAGAFTQKGGMHGLARAFDLDGIFWSHFEFVTLKDGYQGRDRSLYFGIECILRRHFGTVLSYLYNKAHHDHFHVDDGSPVSFNSNSDSRVKFVQGALNVFWGAGLQVDGRYGPQTARAIDEALTRLGLSGTLGTKQVWLDFLWGCAKKGLS